ncbi:MAG: HAD hydrolase-like protein [Nanoarchaeota archaeon]
MNKAHAVLWDAGGVIYTFDQGKTDRKLAARCGKTQEEISATLFGGAAEGKEYNKGLVEPYNLGHINSRTFYENVKRELGLDMSFDEFAEAWSDIFTLNEDIVYYIRASREEGIKQGVLSSTNPLHWEGMKRLYNLEEALGKEVVVCTFHPDAGEKKPHPRLFDISLRKLSTLKEETVYVDDVKKYVDAAISFGMLGLHCDNSRPDFQERCMENLVGLLHQN